MSKTIAVFGAGPGMGASVARRFGREGHRVALVARRAHKAQALADSLAADGIEAAVFTADLSQPDVVPGLVEAIEGRYGHLDVAYYGPIPESNFIPAADLEPAALAEMSGLLLLTPVALVRAVLPGMIQRGEGAVLVVQGLSAVHPIPGMSGPGPLMAATRNYLYSLHGELTGTGVYAGTLSVGAFIEGSEAHARMSRSGEAEGFPTARADDLADLLWNLAAKGDRAEEIYPPVAVGS